MAFMNELYKQMTQEKQTTENGAIGYRTSGKQLLDANFAVSSMRDWGNERIRQMFTKVYYENPLLAVAFLSPGCSWGGHGRTSYIQSLYELAVEKSL